MTNVNRQSLYCQSETVGIVTRRGCDGRPQTLIFAYNNRILKLESSDGKSYAVGSPLHLTDGETQQAYQPRIDGYCSPVYDAKTDCVYWVEDYAIMCMDNRNVVTIAAGRKGGWGDADGCGSEALFRPSGLSPLTTDNRGTLFLLERSRIRTLVVANGSALTTTHFLPEMPDAPGISCLAYDTHSGDLLGASASAVCRLLRRPNGIDLRAEALAGQPQDHAVQGRAYHSAWPTMAVDKQGGVYMASGAGHLFRVDTSSGRVTTLLDDLPAGSWRPSILPQGGLAMSVFLGLSVPIPHSLLILTGLGMKAAPLSAPAHEPLGQPAAGAALPRLLRGPRVVVVSAGGKRFCWVRMQLLTESSEYFKALLEGGPGAGAAAGALPPLLRPAVKRVRSAGNSVQEIELDAEPKVFARLVDGLYTGQLDVPRALLRPVAELAARLRMRGACAQLEAPLLAATTPATVVSDLRWAQRHGLTGLLPGLKAFFLRHARQVVRQRPGSARARARGGPALVAAVLRAMAEGL